MRSQNCCNSTSSTACLICVAFERVEGDPTPQVPQLQCLVHRGRQDVVPRLRMPCQGMYMALVRDEAPYSLQSHQVSQIADLKRRPWHWCRAGHLSRRI